MTEYLVTALETSEGNLITEGKTYRVKEDLTYPGMWVVLNCDDEERCPPPSIYKHRFTRPGHDSLALSEIPPAPAVRTLSLGTENFLLERRRCGGYSLEDEHANAFMIPTGAVDELIALLTRAKEVDL